MGQKGGGGQESHLTNILKYLVYFENIQALLVQIKLVWGKNSVFGSLFGVKIKQIFLTVYFQK